MHLRSFATLSLGIALASCTALFLPTEQRVPTRLELSPREITVKDQGKSPVTVTLYDQNDEPFAEIPGSVRLEWKLSDPALATLLPGEVKGERQGTGWIIVTSGDLTAVAKLTVTGIPRFLQAASGLRLEGIAGRPLAEPVVIRVTDRLGAGIGDVPVKLKVVEGKGTVPAEVVKSDASGFVRVNWTLGPKVGQNVLEATSDSLQGEAIRFTAEAGPDGVARLDKVAGDQQRATVGTSLAQDLVVRAMDQNGNPVPLAGVSWGTELGEIIPASLVTDENGFARAHWRLGIVARNLTTTARSGAAEVRFAATAVPGPPASLQRVSGNGQSAPEGYPLPDSLVVRVADAFDNPISGVEVHWQVTHGGGSIAPTTSTTRADGLARAQWRAGISLPNFATASAFGRQVGFQASPRHPVPRDTLRNPSGLRYIEIVLAKDTAAVRTGDVVSVYFSAFRPDGYLLERIRNKVDPPLRFVVGSGQVIAGFSEGVVGMRKGSVRRLFIPGSLGYGNQWVNQIPPNSELVFDVEVVDITRAATTSVPLRPNQSNGGQAPPEAPYK